ncbi:putative asparagine synthetase [Podospora fimiseda]|uniref:Asparagine synthetase n=1 Tax=Podospora fimiseda TaxID=252190 RepID=A0AAN7BEG6_9PEZI|nr:putative asparagine synthetase [Podospora fimiseda]
MCGITACIALPGGKLAQQPEHQINGHNENINEQLQSSVDILFHRGPDESGTWISKDTNIALGHSRLSINDLSPSGSQPLVSDDGQIHAVVNGEIYDQDRLWKECRENHGYKFRGESDSELVVALYKIHGAPGLFKHLRGEFAFVLYDSREGQGRVIAARDRFGIKPLVWTVANGQLLVASEAKAFLPLGWKPEWDVTAIASAAWMLDQRTLFKGVQKVLPGHYLEVTEENGVQDREYWDAEYEDKIKIETRSVEEMVEGVRQRLIDSIRLRLRADVPVGIYLSGGIDSSAVAGIVTHLSKTEHVKIGDRAPETPVTCFSVRFPEESGYDESSIADRTATWLGVKTIKVDVDEARLAQDFSDTVWHCEHHHFDLNTVAKFALSTLPRDHGVKVVLTGEGADEHFSGYPYFPAEFLCEPDLAMPDTKLASNHDLREEMRQTIDREMRAIWRYINANQYDGRPDHPVLEDANARGMSETVLAWHPTLGLFSPWVQDQYKDLDCRTTVMESHPTSVRAKMRSRWHPLHTAMYMWNKSSLANILLSCLGDRTEMAHSVEARTPFLDHHLAEYVNRLPPSVKLSYTPPEPSAQNGVGEQQGPVWKSAGSGLQSLTEKWILREAVKPFITDELYRRRKHPFLAPTKWPKGGPMHRMFGDLLTKESVEKLGFVDWNVVEKALSTGFGDQADGRAFRTLSYVGAWVTLGEKLGVAQARMED